MKRRHALGMISHITPVALTIFLILWYAPFIAAFLRAQGWEKTPALTVGFAVPIVWLALGIGAIFVLPPRFVKLNWALQMFVFGVPIAGMFALAFWVVVKLVFYTVR